MEHFSSLYPQLSHQQYLTSFRCNERYAAQKIIERNDMIIAD